MWTISKPKYTRPLGKAVTICWWQLLDTGPSLWCLQGGTHIGSCCSIVRALCIQETSSLRDSKFPSAPSSPTHKHTLKSAFLICIRSWFPEWFTHVLNNTWNSAWRFMRLLSCNWGVLRPEQIGYASLTVSIMLCDLAHLPTCLIHLYALYFQ